MHFDTFFDLHAKAGHGNLSISINLATSLIRLIHVERSTGWWLDYLSTYIQWNPLNTKLKGLMKSVHVIRISCYQNNKEYYKCIAGVIFYFHVNQNFVLSQFMLSGFHCNTNDKANNVAVCILQRGTLSVGGREKVVT